MGVALMTSRCGLWALPASSPRCRTPKRCCSSTMASPRLRNWTESVSTAWVPHHQPGPAVCDGRQGDLLFAGFHTAHQQRHIDAEGLQPVRQVGRMLPGQDLGGGQHGALPAVLGGEPDGGRRHQRFARCPRPPCSSRFIGVRAHRSCTISPVARRWAPVGGIGQAAPERFQVQRPHGGAGSPAHRGCAAGRCRSAAGTVPQKSACVGPPPGLHDPAAHERRARPAPWGAFYSASAIPAAAGPGARPHRPAPPGRRPPAGPRAGPRCRDRPGTKGLSAT